MKLRSVRTVELAPTKHVPFEKLFGVAAFVGDACHEGKWRGEMKATQIRYAVDDVFI
jgi:hypothetical protein